MATGGNDSALGNILISTIENSSTKFCNGMLGIKDLRNNKVQSRIKIVLKYFVTGEEDDHDYKYKTVRGENGPTKYYSLFCNSCNGGSETVK